MQTRENDKDNVNMVANVKNNIIVDSLRYYDKNMMKYNSFFNKIKRIEIEESQYDIVHNNMLFYDKNDNLILQSRYELIGIYSVIGKIWAWSWATPANSKNKIQIIKKVLNYGIDLNPSDLFLKTELITSRFKITNKIQIDIHVAIASYLSKQPLIYKHKVKKIEDNEDIGLHQYLILLDYDKIDKKILND